MLKICYLLSNWLLSCIFLFFQSEYEEYRHELRTLFGNITQLDQRFVLDTIHQMVRHSHHLLNSNGMEKSSFPLEHVQQIDVTLNLFYLFGEICKVGLSGVQFFFYFNVLLLLCAYVLTNDYVVHLSARFNSMNVKCGFWNWMTYFLVSVNRCPWSIARLFYSSRMLSKCGETVDGTVKHALHVLNHRPPQCTVLTKVGIDLRRYRHIICPWNHQLLN